MTLNEFVEFTRDELAEIDITNLKDYLGLKKIIHKAKKVSKLMNCFFLWNIIECD